MNSLDVSSEEIDTRGELLEEKVGENYLIRKGEPTKEKPHFSRRNYSPVRVDSYCCECKTE